MDTYKRIISADYLAYKIISDEKNKKSTKKVNKNEKSDVVDVTEEKDDIVEEKDDIVEGAQIDNVEEKFNEDQFWQFITELNWRNADEEKITFSQFKKRLPVEKMQYIKTHIGQFAEHVENACSAFGWFATAPRDTVNNFTYHIVGLGKESYLGAICDTNFTQFIWDSEPVLYQNLHTMLSSSF